MPKLTKSAARLWSGKGTWAGLADVAKPTRSAQGSHPKPHWSLLGSHWHSWVPRGKFPPLAVPCPLHPSSTEDCLPKLPPSYKP